MRRHKGHHGIVPPRLDHQSGHRWLRQCDQPDVQRPIRQLGQGFLRREHCHLNVDGGVVLAQHLQGLRQQVRNCASRRTEPHAPFEPTHLTLDIVQGLLRVGQQPTRTLHQHFSDRRRLHISTLARQKRRPDAVFQFRDMEADRWRRQVQCTRGIGK
jgi:hypothetical protein